MRLRKVGSSFAALVDESRIPEDDKAAYRILSVVDLSHSIQLQAAARKRDHTYITGM